jgi:antitoxin HicB
MVQSPRLQLKQPLPQTLGSCLLKAIKSDQELSQDKMMFSYPVNLEADDDGTILAWFPDLTGATFGEDEAEALANAVDLLETVMIGFITDRQAIPPPSAAKGRKTVSPSLLGALKLSVYQAMCNMGWRKADLARAMGLDPRQIDRLLDLRHTSTVAQLEQSLAACGARFEVGACQLDPAR